jgi:hypothetical protein
MFAGAFVLGQRGSQVVGGDEARLDQALTELLSHRRLSFAPYTVC